MAATNRAGISEFVMRGRQYLTAVRADKGLLALHTLYFADEIRDPRKELDVPKADKPRGAELSMAKELIDSMAGPWHPDDFKDTYQKRVKALIKDKRAGRTTEPAAEPAEPTTVVDLTEALRDSLRKKSAAKGKPTDKGKATEKDDDLGELSKADLTKLARKLGVSGRSTMSRAELQRAVRKAQRNRTDRKAS
jgi:DNA end-binding protein Ku